MHVARSCERGDWVTSNIDVSFAQATQRAHKLIAKRKSGR